MKNWKKKPVIKIIIKFILVFSILSCKAQVIEYTLGNTPRHLPSDNYYVKDNNNYYNVVLGSWKSETEASKFIITLEKQEKLQDFSFNRFRDAVFGKYQYMENETIVSEINETEVFPNMKVAFFYETPTKFRVVIKDVISDTNKIGEFILTSPTTAEMRLWNSEGIKINYGNGQPWALPTYFEFTKQQLSPQ